jgi:hypothetical protein
MHRHASTGHARVHVNGKTYWLGPYGSPEAQVKYDALVAAYIATGRKSVETAVARPATPPPPAPDLTIAELSLAYLRHVQAAKGDGWKQSSTYQSALSATRALRPVATMPAKSFGPRQLLEVRETFAASKTIRRNKKGEVVVEKPRTRRYVNDVMQRVVAMFSWAAVRELVPGDKPAALREVKPLRSGEVATAAVTRSLRYAPPHIRRSVNRARRRSGLTELHFASATPDVGVWVRDRATGTIRPATTTTSRSPARPATPRATPRPVPAVVERVLIVPCPSFADAPARNVRSAFDETIAPDAFGPAAELNRDDRWDLRLGHHGPRLALPGPALRAHDTSHGLVVEWHLDSRMPMAPEAREAIRRGAVSVAFKAIGTRTIRLPEPTTLVTRATLLHVALLPDNQQPAHPAAVAMLFPGSRLGDDRELREQIDAVIRESKFRNWRSKS